MPIAPLCVQPAGSVKPGKVDARHAVRFPAPVNAEMLFT